MKWQKSNNQKCHSSQVCHKFRAKWDEELCDTQTQALQTSPKVWTLDPEEKKQMSDVFLFFHVNFLHSLFGVFLGTLNKTYSSSRTCVIKKWC